jgi:hypothetical protein
VLMWQSLGAVYGPGIGGAQCPLVVVVVAIVLIVIVELAAN